MAIDDWFRFGHLTRTWKFPLSFSPNHKTCNLRAVAQIANYLSISILSFLSKRTPLLAEHIATLNEDYISQLPLPPAVAMWSNSGQWHTRESVIWNFWDKKGGGHILCLSIYPPSSRLALQEHPWTRRWPYSKIMDLTEGPVPLVTVEPPQSWASCFQILFPERKHVGAF